MKNIFKKIGLIFKKPRSWKKYLIAGLFVIVFVLGAAAGYFYFKKSSFELSPQNNNKSPYIEFISEVYDKIKENYWQKNTDEQLGKLFKLAIEKLTNKPQNYEIENKTDFLKMSENIMKIVKPEKKKEFITQLAGLVLANLQPKGRSALYTIQDKKDLANRVRNINPENNLYQALGIEKNASEKDVEEAYQEKLNELSQDDSEEAKKELETVKYAYQVLSSDDQKENYDQAGTEPTVFAKKVRPKILHLYIKKISPTTFNEFVGIVNKFNGVEGLDSLILDLRANVGGSLDVISYILGPFIGENQYAYELFHQDDYTPYKTKTGWLPGLFQYKKVVILIDGDTQSSAEVIAATLKKYNVGVTVGTKTKGWGTIEAVVDIDQELEDEKYSMFLVHSLTLRDDNEPIQGNSVYPLISIGDPDWKNQLFTYFNYSELNEAVEEIWNKPPGQL